ncbi:unnamed protein product, partial [marine sediment metagenome]
MPETDINKAVVTEVNMTDYSVDTMQTDASGEQRETTWMNTK